MIFINRNNTVKVQLCLSRLSLLVSCIAMILLFIFIHRNQSASSREFVEAKKDCPEIKNYLKDDFFTIGELESAHSICSEMKKLTERQKEIKKTYAL